PELTRLADPSKSASSYMQRLFKKAGIEGTAERSFIHSEAGTSISCARPRSILATPGRPQDRQRARPLWLQGHHRGQGHRNRKCKFRPPRGLLDVSRIGLREICRREAHIRP